MPIVDGKFVLTKTERGERSGIRFNFVSALILALFTLFGLIGTGNTQNPLWLVVGVLLGILFAQSP